MNKLTAEIDREFKKRFNKHFYFKSVEKISKKKERKFSKRSEELNKSVLIELEMFWRCFDLLSDKVKKIELLSEYSEKIFRKRSFESIRYKRNRFLDNKRYFGMTKEGCRVCCSFKEVIRHHIIQLQNGGCNHFRNLITLCAECHGMIHDWIRVDDQVTQEYKSIFSIGNHNCQWTEGKTMLRDQA